MHCYIDYAGRNYYNWKSFSRAVGIHCGEPINNAPNVTTKSNGMDCRIFFPEKGEGITLDHMKDNVREKNDKPKQTMTTTTTKMMETQVKTKITTMSKDKGKNTIDTTDEHPATTLVKHIDNTQNTTTTFTRVNIDDVVAKEVERQCNEIDRQYEEKKQSPNTNDEDDTHDEDDDDEDDDEDDGRHNKQTRQHAAENEQGQSSFQSSRSLSRQVYSPQIIHSVSSFWNKSDTNISINGKANPKKSSVAIPSENIRNYFLADRNPLSANTDKEGNETVDAIDKYNSMKLDIPVNIHTTSQINSSTREKRRERTLDDDESNHKKHKKKQHVTMKKKVTTPGQPFDITRDEIIVSNDHMDVIDNDNMMTFIPDDTTDYDEEIKRHEEAISKREENMRKQKEEINRLKEQQREYYEQKMARDTIREIQKQNEDIQRNAEKIKKQREEEDERIRKQREEEDKEKEKREEGQKEKLIAAYAKLGLTKKTQ